MYPEIHGRTLGELTFCESSASLKLELEANALAMFEDKELAVADKAVLAVEKEIHADAYDPAKQYMAHTEHLGEKQIPFHTA
jgi:hypothetical protein